MPIKKESVTGAQQEGLRTFGIEAPPTKNAASSLLKWIRQGGSESGKRVAIIIDTQRNFGGKRVQRRQTPETKGVVNYIYWAGLGARSHASEFSHRYNHPLTAVVTWDTGLKSTASISSLEVAPE